MKKIKAVTTPQDVAKYERRIAERERSAERKQARLRKAFSGSGR